jgi:hypothetical protein
LLAKTAAEMAAVFFTKNSLVALAEFYGAFS